MGARRWLPARTATRRRRPPAAGTSPLGSPRAGRLFAVLLGYLGLAVLAFAGLRLASMVVLPVLLTVSIVHFGAADLITANLTNDDATSARRGVVGGSGSMRSSNRAIRLPAAVRLGAAPSRTAGAVVGAVLLATIATCTALALRRGRLVEAGEVVLLGVLFTVAPPLAAFGVSFGLWHGLRHTARLLADDPANDADLARDRLARPLLHFLAAAAVPSAVAVTTAVVLVRLTVGHAGLPRSTHNLGKESHEPDRRGHRSFEGIGRATARAFAARGDTVLLLARGTQGLEGAADDVRRAGGSAVVIPLDVADHEAVQAAVDRIENEVGPIDVWVNVAFTAVFARFWHVSAEEFKRATDCPTWVTSMPPAPCSSR